MFHKYIITATIAIIAAIIAVAIKTYGFKAATALNADCAATKAHKIPIPAANPKNTVPQSLTVSLFCSTHLVISCTF